MKFTISFSRLLIVLSLFLWPIGLILTNRDWRPSFSLPKTVFAEDYQARQLILRNTYLYPNVFLARVFQNKLNIPVGKFENNFLALIDPNYYFFSSHPRELYRNQNLVKLPFILLLFLVYGLMNIAKLSNYKRFGGLFLLLAVLLSLLENFDKYDLVLWPILFLVIFHGYQLFRRRYLMATNIILLFLSLITIWEYVRLFTKV